MDSEGTEKRASEVESATDAQFTGETEREDVPAWEQVEAGRYMPRRIKGSCKGRALG